MSRWKKKKEKTKKRREKETKGRDNQYSPCFCEGVAGRFILDALRNGSNGLIQVQERIVLSRAHDVVTDILDLLEPLEPPFESNGKMDWSVELLVVDFRTRSYPSF